MARLNQIIIILCTATMLFFASCDRAFATPDFIQGQLNDIFVSIQQLAYYSSGSAQSLTKEARAKLVLEALNMKLRLLGILYSLQSELLKAHSLSNYKIRPQLNYDLDYIALKIYEAVNQKRAENGSMPLQWDGVVAAVASDHSYDQALDNIELVNPSLSCHYPLIRHESFDQARGYNVGDRLRMKNIFYQIAGENIVAVPISKDWIYSYIKPDKIDCLGVAGYKEEAGSYSEKYQLYNLARDSRTAAMETLKPVTWINKDWKWPLEIAQEVVELWFNSSRHKENMLHQGFKMTGIGIATVGNYLIATQVFVEY